MKTKNNQKYILFLLIIFSTQFYFSQIIREIKVIKADCNETKSKVIFYRNQSCTVYISTTINGVLHLTQVSLNGSSMIDTLKLIPGTYFFNSRNEYNQQSNQVIVGRVEPLKIITNQKNNVVCEGYRTKLSVPFAKKYLWSTGDTTAQIYVSKPGKYSVKIVDPIEKTCSLNDSIEISLNPKLIVDVIQNRTDCESDCSTNVKFIPKGGSGPYVTSYWPEGICFEGCATKVDSVQNQCYNPSGWTVSVTDSKGCYIEKLYHILPNSKNLKIKNSTPLSFCEGDSVTLNIDKSENSKYQWYRNGNKISHINPNLLVIKESGNYSVTITSENCVINSDTVSVNVKPLSTPIILGPSGDVCLKNVTIFSTTPGKKGYEWKIPNQIKGIDYNILPGGSDTSSTFQLEWKTLGYKEVYLIYKGEECSSKNESKTFLNIIATDSIYFSGPEVSNTCIAQLNTYTFSKSNRIGFQQQLNWEINGANGVDYELIDGGLVNDTFITLKWLKPLSKNIRVYSNNQCMNELLFHVNVYDSIPSFTITGDKLINKCNSDSLLLTIPKFSNVKYHWFLNDVELSNAIDSFIVVKKEGNYRVELTNEGNCSIKSQDLEIKIDECATLSPLNLSHLIKIIPNPAKENIQLIGNKKEKSIVKIYNNMGQLELQTTLNTGNEFINIEQLNNGIYILMIETQQNETIHRSKLKIEK